MRTLYSPRVERIASLILLSGVRLLAAVALLSGVPGTAYAEPIDFNVPSVANGLVGLRGGVLGNYMLAGSPGSTGPSPRAATPAGLLEMFSFWLLDPGADSGSLSYKTGIARFDSNTASRITQPENFLYESDWQTVASGGGVHRIDTPLASAITFNPGDTYFFYILTNTYAGPAWQLMTNRNAAMDSASAPRHAAGVYGLSVGGGYTDWADPVAPGSVRFNDLQWDADLAMCAQFSSVPEPTTLLLLGVGAAGAAMARSRRRSWKA